MLNLNKDTAAMEFAVEDILFEEMEAVAPPPVTAEDAARSSTSSSGLILPSMTIDPADTKTPYSDATQVGKSNKRKERKEAGSRRARRNSHLAQ